MLIVGSDPSRVETDLLTGAIGCPSCRGVLARWGFARRRSLRGDEGPVRVRPRRGRCRSCRSTHVLLPDVALLRRVDTVAVIGRAVTARASGAGRARVAVELGRPLSTVRGWLRRFAAATARIATHFTVWAHRLDPNLGPVVSRAGTLLAALEAIGVAARAASLRWAPRPPWSWVAVLTVGRLLCNTNSPWLAP